jgi:hypothetical protein
VSSKAARRRRRAQRAHKRVLDPPAWVTESVWPIHPDPAASYDTVGRRQLHRLNFVHYARVVPGLAAQFTGRVPDDFVARIDEDHVDIACPCGATPRCELLVPKPCACERTFVWDGKVVRVAGSPR